METFEDLGISQETLSILDKKWYKTPSEIQKKTIPLLLKGGTDAVWQSQTWTGKTAAFGVPIIENLLKNKKENWIKAVILTPSRELAIQVSKEIKSFVWNRKLSVQSIYGWQSYLLEKRSIKKWIDILIWTPGRVIDHLKNKLLDFSNIDYFVLDEADEMLNMGFIDDIKLILESCSQEKTSLFFSATMPKSIMSIAKKYMKNYKTIKIESNTLTSSLTQQKYYTVKRENKLNLLVRLIDIEWDFYGIVFCRTKADVNDLLDSLSSKWYNVDCLHWDITQAQREKAIKRFKNWDTKILVATDVAARWLDINNLSHVINFSIPQNPEEYTHRIGRTWRAGKQGTAITFVTPAERRKIDFITYKTKSEIKKEEIPSIDDILKIKLDNFKKNIWENLKSNKDSNFDQIAEELLKSSEPKEVISSLLSFFMKDYFSDSKYWKIEKPKFSEKGGNFWNGKNSSKRLFIAQGKQDWMTPKKMVDFISAKTWIQKKNIDDMQVLPKFSFFNAPEKEAFLIVDHFKKQWRNWKPLISFAKKRE